MSAFSVENPHNGKTFENYTRFEWGVEVGVVTTFVLRLFVPHEFDMLRDGSAPQLISVVLANSILCTPREETTVRAVTVSRV